MVLTFALGGRKEILGSPLHLSLPLTDLRRMKLILPGQLVDGLEPFQGFKSHLAFKL